MSAKQFFTTGECARVLGVSAVTVFRSIEKGQLKSATTPGGHNRVPRAALQAFAESMGIDPTRVDSGRTRVLIVEDNPAELRMLQRALEKESSFEVQTTASGYGAGYLTKAFRPDILLLDIFLDDLDGREVVKLIRADPEIRHMHILAVTGASDAKDLREIEASGVDEIVPKPIDGAALREKILKLSE